MDEKATMGQSLRSMEDEETIDLMELARLLWAHAVQIVAAAVAAALICLLVCMFALTPKYQTSINMIVNTRQDTTTTFTSDNFNSAKNLISTYAVIIKSSTVLNEVIDTLDLDMTYGQLYGMVSVTSVDDTQIMKVAVTDTDAERAGEIAQTISEIVPDVLVEKVEAGSCKTVSNVSINPNKVFPQTKKYVVLAGVLGAVVVCGILVLAHLLHDTIVDDEDVQNKLGLPMLSLIPEA
jgi:capsular polysaccharide biosynthesis protein